MKVYIVYWQDWDSWGIDKVFDTEEKAVEYIKFKPQMTGDSWGYFDREIE